MFTGIIRGLGTVTSVTTRQESQRLTVSEPLIQEIHSQIGDSLAVNGVCLTITDLQEDCFSVDVMPETFRRTNLRMVKVGTKLNLEPALKASQRLDGHFVLGHVDTTGTVVDQRVDGNAMVVTIDFPSNYDYQIVEKGSIAVNGVSLTVIQVSHHKFSVSLIPHTLRETTLSTLKTGDLVNLETDILGKYVISQRKEWGK